MYATAPRPPTNQFVAICGVPVVRRRHRFVGSRRQQRFLLGVKLIIKSLESGSPMDQFVALQVKATIREYTRQNRAGLKPCMPLQDKLEARLRQIVGGEAFLQAMFLVDFYMAKRRLGNY